MRKIVQIMFTEMLIELELTDHFTLTLTPVVLSLLAQSSPRTTKEQLRLAIGNACARAKSLDKNLINSQNNSK